MNNKIKSIIYFFIAMTLLLFGFHLVYIVDFRLAWALCLFTWGFTFCRKSEELLTKNK